MLALPARSEDMQLRTVRLRGAADGLRARQRMEAALADIAPSTLGLPPQALLIVRRIAPKARLRLDAAAHGEEFRRSVGADLEVNLRRARRPWLDRDAGAADAVLFADEIELMVCLVRDFLRGALPERWWWPVVLRGLSAPQWWRSHVLPRGDVLPALLAQLAVEGGATAWVVRLDRAEVAQATTALIEAHALNFISDRGDGSNTTGVNQRPTNEHSSRRAATRETFSEVRRQLIALVPELQASHLVPAQRRLLGLALGLQRASAWVRSEAFAVALQAIDSAAVVPEPDIAVVAAAPDDTPQATSSDSPYLRQLRTKSRVPCARATVERDIAPAIDSVQVSVPQVRRRRELARRARPRPKSAKHHVAAPAPESTSGERVLEPEIAGSPQTVSSQARSAPPDLPALSPLASPVPEFVSPQVIETQFGGLFYLLNVALALGLYGDFTQPRNPGLTLSPWDLLALIGRAWFGGAFVRDPVWTLLAELAGREPCEPPGTEFTPPNAWSVPESWLAPWQGAAVLGVRATRNRLQLWHRAGFIVIDVPRDRAMTPFAQARELCCRNAFLRAALLTRNRKRPPECNDRSSRDALGRWLTWMLLYLDARLARALSIETPAEIATQLARHRATLYRTSTRLDVHLSLASLPLAVRIAGLDRDPGWIPAVGRTLEFHFE